MNNGNNFLRRILFFLTILVFTFAWISGAVTNGTNGILMAVLGGLFLVPTVFLSARNIFNPVEEQPPSPYGGRRERQRYLRYYNEQKVRNGDKTYFKSWFRGEILSIVLMLIILVEMAVSSIPILSQILVMLILSLQITEFISILSDYRKNKKSDNWNRDDDPWDL